MPHSIVFLEKNQIKSALYCSYENAHETTQWKNCQNSEIYSHSFRGLNISFSKKGEQLTLQDIIICYTITMTR